MQDDQNTDPAAELPTEAQPAPLPKANGGNGRRPDGRFAPGNPGGPGNPQAAKVGQLRQAFFAAVSLADFRKVVKKLVAEALQGDTTAAKLLLERLLGPPVAIDLAGEITECQAAIARLQGIINDKLAENQPTSRTVREVPLNGSYLSGLTAATEARRN